ncbi:MAG: hypothetical protein AB7S88_05490 [Candidatus Izemoplasmatales bacterium]
MDYIFYLLIIVAPIVLIMGIKRIRRMLATLEEGLEEPTFVRNPLLEEKQIKGYWCKLFANRNERSSSIIDRYMMLTKKKRQSLLCHFVGTPSPEDVVEIRSYNPDGKLLSVISLENASLFKPTETIDLPMHTRYVNVDVVNLQAREERQSAYLEKRLEVYTKVGKRISMWLFLLIYPITYFIMSLFGNASSRYFYIVEFLAAIVLMFLLSFAHHFLIRLWAKSLNRTEETVYEQISSEI